MGTAGWWELTDGLPGTAPPGGISQLRAGAPGGEKEPGMPAEGWEGTGFSPTCLLAQAGPDLGHPILLGSFTAGALLGQPQPPSTVRNVLRPKHILPVSSSVNQTPFVHGEILFMYFLMPLRQYSEETSINDTNFKKSNN